jgi:hypothetical protein
MLLRTMDNWTTRDKRSPKRLLIEVFLFFGDLPLFKSFLTAVTPASPFEQGKLSRAPRYDRQLLSIFRVIAITICKIFFILKADLGPALDKIIAVIAIAEKKMMVPRSVRRGVPSLQSLAAMRTYQIVFVHSAHPPIRCLAI